MSTCKQINLPPIYWARKNMQLCLRVSKEDYLRAITCIRQIFPAGLQEQHTQRRVCILGSQRTSIPMIKITFATQLSSVFVEKTPATHEQKAKLCQLFDQLLAENIIQSNQISDKLRASIDYIDEISAAASTAEYKY